MAVLPFKKKQVISNGPTANKPDSKQEKHPLFIAEEHALTRLLTLYTFDDSSKVNSSRPRPIIHPSFWMITFDEWIAHTVRF